MVKPSDSVMTIDELSAYLKIASPRSTSWPQRGQNPWPKSRTTLAVRKEGRGSLARTICLVMTWTEGTMPTPERKAPRTDRREADGFWCGPCSRYRDMNLGAAWVWPVTEFPGARPPSGLPPVTPTERPSAWWRPKPVGHTLKGVEGQSRSYSDGLPESLPA
jgi:hypothetical protein